MNHIVDPSRLPVFVLFKDLVLSDPYSFDSEITSCTWARAGDDLERLQHQIPLPTIPDDPGRRRMLAEAERFEDYVDPDTGVIDQEGISFDDTLRQLTEPPTDLAIFGESYTVVWLCPPDLDRVTAAVMDHIERRTKGGTKEIDAFLLLEVWRDYLDRHHVAAPLSEEARERWLELNGEVEHRIRSLPNAPSEEAWDELERYL